VLRLDTINDVERLREALRLMESENKRLVEKIVELSRQLMELKGEDASALQLRLEELERQLHLRNQALFGKSSEKRPSPERKEPSATPEAQRGHGRREQPALPLLEVVHDVDEADKTCHQCGGALEEWKGQTEDSEEVDVLERRFVLKRHKRKKYRCRCGGCVETAPAPEKLVEGGRYSVDFAVEVAVGKYLDHAPLERQVRIMQREGLHIDSQTLWDQLEVLARVLTPAHERLHAHVLSLPVIGVDETRWPLLGSDSAGKWHAWSVATPHAVSYRIQDGRSVEAAARVLGGFSGIAMADGLAVYASLAKQGAGFTVANCWAHVRRKFIECQDSFPAAAQAIELIGELYEVERLYLTGPPGEAQLAALRAQRSRAIVSRLQTWAVSVRALPQSGLGKAISYMGGLWTGLTRFLDDARIPLDNNATERALRGVVLGRKNHYGSRSHRGTEVAALFYSLLESAKLAGIEPKAYLRNAALAGLRRELIPLPHELIATAAP